MTLAGMDNIHRTSQPHLGNLHPTWNHLCPLTGPEETHHYMRGRRRERMACSQAWSIASGQTCVIGVSQDQLLTQKWGHGVNLSWVRMNWLSFHLNPITTHFPIQSGCFLKAFQKMGFSRKIKVKTHLLFCIRSFRAWESYLLRKYQVIWNQQYYPVQVAIGPYMLNSPYRKNKLDFFGNSGEDRTKRMGQAHTQSCRHPGLQTLTVWSGYHVPLSDLRQMCQEGGWQTLLHWGRLLYLLNYIGFSLLCSDWFRREKVAVAFAYPFVSLHSWHW